MIEKESFKKTILIILTMMFAAYTAWSQIPVDGSKIIKVLSFNILHGATTKGDFDLDLIAKVIADANPDFVALQEVDYKTKRSKKYDLVTELGWRTKMAPLFARAMYYDNGEYGEGVLSKYTFIQTKNIALPFTPGNEPRAALEIITVIPSGDTIAFVGTHLDHLDDEKDRVAQVKKINEAFSSSKYPTILAGDLNAIPGSTPINILEEMWTPYYPKNRWKILKTEVIQDSVASDHCSYLVTIELLDN
jgi:endonuclease/exonuclease/phosphatase family metal-dependent hydrolase